MLASESLGTEGISLGLCEAAVRWVHVGAWDGKSHRGFCGTCAPSCLQGVTKGLRAEGFPLQEGEVEEVKDTALQSMPASSACHSVAGLPCWWEVALSRLPALSVLCTGPWASSFVLSQSKRWWRNEEWGWTTAMTVPLTSHTAAGSGPKI